jgi:hypothetical protein
MPVCSQGFCAEGGMGSGQEADIKIESSETKDARVVGYPPQRSWRKDIRLTPLAAQIKFPILSRWMALTSTALQTHQTP